MLQRLWALRRSDIDEEVVPGDADSQRGVSPKPAGVFAQYKEMRQYRSGTSELHSKYLASETLYRRALRLILHELRYSLVSSHSHFTSIREQLTW